MTRTYRLCGLNCAHCAAKIEEETAKYPGVTNVTLNLALQRLTITHEENADVEAMDQKLTEYVAVLEPLVKVICLDKGDPEAMEREAEAEQKKEEHRELMFIGIGALLCIISLFVPDWLQWVLRLVAYVLLGGEVLISALKSVRRLELGEELLMTVATIGALCLGETIEACAVMLLYRVGEYLQGKAVDGSRRRIASLMALRPDKVWLVLDGGTEQTDADAVVPGDIIELRTGERAAVDGTILSGSSELDNSALTGESAPVGVTVGDSVSAGAVNMTGILRLKCDRAASESAVARILEMTRNAAAQKAKSENAMNRFAKIYTPCVTAGALLIAVAGGLISGQWQEWVYRALQLLMMSCPCALVLSVPLTFFAGIGAASKKGILFKGGQALENLSKAQVCCFDKTGTLTSGTLSIEKIRPFDGIDEHELLRYAWFCERQCAHPIAKAITAAVTDRIDEEIEDLQEWAGEGIECICEGSSYAAGNHRLMKRLGIEIPEGYADCMVHVARDGQYAGGIDLMDMPRSDTKEALDRLKALGITHMSILTGDGETAARKVAAMVGIDNINASLLPGDKLSEMQKKRSLCTDGGTTVYVGDGINDAPVLAGADTGVAMGAMGRDAAIEAADVVLMEDSLKGLPTAVRLAKKVMTILRRNIAFAICAKAALMLLAVFGLANMWLAVLADTGVALICVAYAATAGLTV